RPGVPADHTGRPSLVRSGSQSSVPAKVAPSVVRILSNSSEKSWSIIVVISLSLLVRSGGRGRVPGRGAAKPMGFVNQRRGLSNPQPRLAAGDAEREGVAVVLCDPAQRCELLGGRWQLAPVLSFAI